MDILFAVTELIICGLDRSTALIPNVKRNVQVQ
jgi:hypothetical protein